MKLIYLLALAFIGQVYGDFLIQCKTSERGTCTETNGLIGSTLVDAGFKLVDGDVYQYWKSNYPRKCSLLKKAYPKACHTLNCDGC